MKPRRTATLDLARVTQAHVAKAQPEVLDLDLAFAAQITADRARMMGDFVKVALMPDSEFDARNAADTEARQAIDDDFAMFR